MDLILEMSCICPGLIINAHLQQQDPLLSLWKSLPASLSDLGTYRTVKL